MNNQWETQIFQQKGLWEVYKVSRRVLPKPRSNRIVFWISAFLLAGLFLWSIRYADQYYTPRQAVLFLRHVANQGIVLSIGVLGFLIAGFAIFASITRVELFITLAKIPYRDGEINRLQFVFFNFLNVFTVYLGLLVYCLLLVIGLAEYSPAIRLGNVLQAHMPGLALPAIFLLVSLLGVWLVSAILKLKSFIWNLYQTVLVSIATEAKFPKEDRKQP